METFIKPLVSVRRLLKIAPNILFPVLEIKLTFKMLAKGSTIASHL